MPGPGGGAGPPQRAALPPPPFVGSLPSQHTLQRPHELQRGLGRPMVGFPANTLQLLLIKINIKNPILFLKTLGISENFSVKIGFRI